MQEEHNNQGGGAHEHSDHGHGHGHDEGHGGGHGHGEGGHDHDDDDGHEKQVTVVVNEKPVTLNSREVTGKQVKEAAIAQGVAIALDFVLSLREGHRWRVIGDDERIKVTKKSVFTAVTADDNSDTTHIKPEVQKAIEEVRESVASEVTVRSDGQGGAFVIIDDVELGPAYVQSSSWLGFLISFQYPAAEIYPHFLRGDLQRKDGAALTPPLSNGHTFESRPAVQLSRRSKGWNASLDTAAIKLSKVLQWLRS